MPAPYSYDLRAKAVNAVKEGAKNTEVCRMLKISRNTLDLWLKRERTSWIAALKEGKVFAPLTFEGSGHRHLVEAWLRESLLPQLEPGDLIVMDNATFHKGQTITELVEEAGCDIWYLPPSKKQKCFFTSIGNAIAFLNRFCPSPGSRSN